MKETKVVFLNTSTEKLSSNAQIEKLEAKGFELLRTEPEYMAFVRDNTPTLEALIEALEAELRIERTKNAIHSRHVERVDPKYAQWDGPHEDFKNK